MTPPIRRVGAYLRVALPLVIAAAFFVPALHARAATLPRNVSLPKVTGLAWVGKTLSATVGSWTGSPTPTYAYAWQRCTAGTSACANITLATKTSYVPGVSDKGSQIRVKVTAKNSAGSTVAYSVNTATVTQPIPPANSQPPGITGSPLDGSTLTATAGVWAGSPAPTYTYQWQRCTSGSCTAIGASGPQYPVAPADVGRTIAVLVTATNVAGSASKQSLPTAVVKAQAATNTSPPAIVGVPTAGTALASSAGAWTGTPTLTFAYQWNRCDAAGQNCTNIAGATASTYLPSPGDIGSTLQVTLSASNAAGTSATVSSSVSPAVVPGADPPADVSAPSIDASNPSDGDTLNAISGQWVGAASVARQWQSCDATSLNCQDLAGATSTSYVAQATDVDHTIVLREVATNPDGNSLAFSAPTAVVAPRAPAIDPSTPPSVAGRAISGSTLTAVPGTWTGTPTIAFAYQWETSADNHTWVPIDGAVGQTYVLAPNDTSQYIHVVVTATNAAASSTQAASAGIGRVLAGGVLWGMSDSWGDGGVRFDATEQQLGRRMALVREYHRIDQAFVGAREHELADSGHSLVVSVRAASAAGTPVPYTDITSGLYDAYFSNGLSELNALGTPAYFIFQHEADGSSAKKSCSTTDDVVCGAQFVAAWRHIRALATAAGDTNVDFVWTVSAYDFSPQTNVRNNNYWPGVADVDWIGIDQYNGGCSGRYMSFSDMLASSVAWTQAKAPGVPVMLAEWGAPEGSTPDAKANFFAGVPSALVQPGYDQIQALVYWNEASSSTCNFRIDTSPQSFSAFAALGLSPSFTQLPLLPPASPPPAPTPPESG